MFPSGDLGANRKEKAFETASFFYLLFKEFLFFLFLISHPIPQYQIMKKNRRDFLKLAGAAGFGFTGHQLLNNLPTSPAINKLPDPERFSSFLPENIFTQTSDETISIIGSYGKWAAGLSGRELPLFSFRRDKWKNIEKWRKASKKRLSERLSMPVIEGVPEVTVVKTYVYGDLYVEELKWKLPYGNPAGGILLKPVNATGRLPGILAFHDHAGNKFFGTQKITKTSDKQHPMMTDHQKDLYQGNAWANEIARRGYVVLVPDAFPFASRRVLLKDIPVAQRQGLSDPDPEDIDGIKAYNSWAGQHEHIMAKSLFSAGTTWPGVFLAEDVKALDILCSRQDVDAERIGCGGLSGGGMRSVFLGGYDPRIKCSVPVGFMTTWRDLVLNKATTHTWMVYVPLLPKEIDLPEILGLRVPLPTLVLNNSEDPLFTLSEMQRADNMLRTIFEKAGAAGNYKCSFHPGPHKFDSPMQAEAFEWFDKWLT